MFAVGLAFVANETGWVSAEVGRQPWVVYPHLEDGVVAGGLHRTQALSEAVEASQVLGSIIFFGVIYSLLFMLWIMLLHHKISEGPEGLEGEAPPPDGGRQPDVEMVAQNMAEGES